MGLVAGAASPFPELTLRKVKESDTTSSSPLSSASTTSLSAPSLFKLPSAFSANPSGSKLLTFSQEEGDEGEKGEGGGEGE